MACISVTLTPSFPYCTGLSFPQFPPASFPRRYYLSHDCIMFRNIWQLLAPRQKMWAGRTPASIPEANADPSAQTISQPNCFRALCDFVAKNFHHLIRAGLSEGADFPEECAPGKSHRSPECPGRAPHPCRCEMPLSTMIVIRSRSCGGHRAQAPAPRSAPRPAAVRRDWRR